MAAAVVHPVQRMSGRKRSRHIADRDTAHPNAGHRCAGRRPAGLWCSGSCCSGRGRLSTAGRTAARTIAASSVPAPTAPRPVGSPSCRTSRHRARGAEGPCRRSLPAVGAGTADSRAASARTSSATHSQERTSRRMLSSSAPRTSARPPTVPSSCGARAKTSPRRSPKTPRARNCAESARIWCSWPATPNGSADLRNRSASRRTACAAVRPGRRRRPSPYPRTGAAA